MTDWRDKLIERVAADVARCGQSVVGIGDGENSFYYTVGRGKRGLPELLLVFALRPDVGQGLLNDLDRRMPEAVPSGERVSVGGKYPVMILDADDPRAKAEYTRIATRFHRRNRYRVQQVVLCDASGRFPPDCDAPYARQPLLGAMPMLN